MRRRSIFAGLEILIVSEEGIQSCHLQLGYLGTRTPGKLLMDRANWIEVYLHLLLLFLSSLLHSRTETARLKSDFILSYAALIPHWSPFTPSQALYVSGTK